MLSDELLDEVFEQCHASTPTATVEAIAIQIKLARDARSRIEEEGIVVRDMKGSVIPHPAIKIEADAIKLYTELLRKSKG
jgi:hypothetical protein